MLIAAFDPGKATGFAVLDTGANAVLEAGKLTDLFNDPNEQQYLRSLLVTHRPDVVVVENYLGSGPRNPDNTNALKLIGFVSGTAQALLPGVTFRQQNPGTRKPWLKDSALALWGTTNYNKAQSHAVDALAHCLRYAHNNPDSDDPPDWSNLYCAPGAPAHCAVNLNDYRGH